MGMRPFTESGGMTVDKLLGNAFRIVEHVEQNLEIITTVAGLSEDIANVSENLNGAQGSIVAEQVAIILAGVANFRSTYAEAIADFEVGAYFTTAESGALRLYKRVSEEPFYEDQGDVVAPISKSLLGGTGGAALVGTTFEGEDEEDIVTVQEALAARPTAETLALEPGAASIGASDTDDELSDVQTELDARPTSEQLAEGTSAASIGALDTDEEPSTVQAQLNARPTAVQLAQPDASEAIGTEALSGENVKDALNGLVVAFVTEAQLEDIEATINVTGKFQGRMAKDTGTGILYIADGPNADDDWVSVDGASTLTPVI